MACLDLYFCTNKSISSWKYTEYFFFLKTVRLPRVTLYYKKCFKVKIIYLLSNQSIKKSKKVYCPKQTKYYFTQRIHKHMNILKYNIYEILLSFWKLDLIPIIDPNVVIMLPNIFVFFAPDSGQFQLKYVVINWIMIIKNCSPGWPSSSIEIYLLPQGNTRSKGLDSVHLHLESEKCNTNYFVTSFPSSYQTNVWIVLW